MANEVEVKITASTEALAQGLSQAESKVQATADSINRIADTIKAAFDDVRTSLQNIDVSLNIDMSAIQQSLNQATNTIRTRLQAVSDDAVIKLKVDPVNLQAQMTSVENTLRTSLSALPVQNLSFDIDLNAVKQKLNQLNTQQAKYRLKLDTANLSAEIAIVKNKITTAFTNGIKARIKPELLQADVSVIRTQLQGVVNKTYKAKLGIDLTYLNNQINLARTMLNGVSTGLNINIDATSNLLRASLDSLRISIDLLRNQMGSGGGGGGGSGGPAGGGGGSGFGGGMLASFGGNILANAVSNLTSQLSQLFSEALRNAREIENMSRLANTTTQEFQEWAFASKSVGVSQEKLGDIMKDVNDKLGDFMQTGGGEMADFFEKIAPKVGVTAKEFQGLSGPQILGKYYETLKKANVSQAEMTFYMESIANDAMLMSPLLDDNAQKLKEYSKQAHDLGIILNDEAIQATKEFQGSLGLIGSTIKGVVANIVADLAPALKQMADNFLTYMVDSKDSVDGAITSIITIFESLASICGSVVGLIGDLWSDITQDIGDGSLQQITFMDLVSGAMKGFASVAVGLKVGIEIAFAGIRAIVTTVCEVISISIYSVMNVFGGFRDTIQYGLDVLSIKFQTFGNVVSNVLNFNFSAAKASWESGLSQLGSITDRYTGQMQSRLTNLKTNWNAGLSNTANAWGRMGETSVNSATTGGQRLQNLFLKNPTVVGSAPPPTPSPTFNANTGIGTGVKDSKGGSAKSKSDADAKARERAAEQEAKAIADIRYKYATQEQKIKLDLDKALKEIEKAKITDAEKAAFKVRAEKDASDKIAALNAEQFEKIKAIREAEIQNKQQQAQRIYEIEKAEIQAEFDAKKISNVQKAHLEKELEDKLREIKRIGLEERLELENELSGKSGKHGNQNQIINNISDLDTDQKVSDTKQSGLISDAEMKDFEAKFGGLTSRMSGLWDKGIQSMMEGTLTWKNSMNAIFSELAAEFIQNMITAPMKKYVASLATRLAVKLGFIKTETAAEVVGQAAQTGAVVAGETTKTMATSTGALARLAIKAGEAIKSIMMYAWEAMAGAFKAMVSIPYIGPVLAVAAGASALALVGGLAGKIKSARGGYDIPAGVNPVTQLHEEEMVLPKQHANTIRALGKSLTSDGGMGGGGGSSAQTLNNFTIQAWDSKDVRRFMEKHGRELAGGLKGYNRNFGR